jgi:phage portal protein BeeE
MPLYTEEDVTNALNALVNGEIKSIRRAASAFGIPSSTLQDRLQKRESRIEGHVSQQLLTSVEETTLENWIYRAAKLGAPITLQLVKILASEIQSERSSNYDENESSPISDRWIDRFRKRHP